MLETNKFPLPLKVFLAAKNQIDMTDWQEKKTNLIKIQLRRYEEAIDRDSKGSWGEWGIYVILT